MTTKNKIALKSCKLQYYPMGVQNIMLKKTLFWECISPRIPGIIVSDHVMIAFFHATVVWQSFFSVCISGIQRYRIIVQTRRLSWLEQSWIYEMTRRRLKSLRRRSLRPSRTPRDYRWWRRLVRWSTSSVPPSHRKAWNRFSTRQSVQYWTPRRRPRRRRRVSCFKVFCSWKSFGPCLLCFEAFWTFFIHPISSAHSRRASCHSCVNW